MKTPKHWIWKYDTILFPCDGFGTGLAKLSEVAPQTMKFMEDLIDDCFGIEYEKYRKEGGIGVEYSHV